jgi:hypothetical protein
MAAIIVVTRTSKDGPQGHSRAAHGHILHRMADRTYLVRLKSPSQAVEQVVASKVQIRGDHLVFVDSTGELVAIFLMDLIQSWKVMSG